MNRGKLTDLIEVAGQPTADAIRALAKQGFAAVVNMRREGEANQPLSPKEEGDVVRAAGMGYRHIPVDPNNPLPEQAAALKEVLKETKGRVFVHCAGGPRAAAVALAASGFTDKEAALAAAANAGFPITNPNQANYVERETSLASLGEGDR